MTKRIFDAIIIVLIATFLMSLSYFELLEEYAKFMFIPIFAFYLIGQYAERRFKD